MSGAWRLKGPCEIKLLGQALDEVVRRHEALRTSFAYQEGSLSQVISPSVSVPFEVKDLSETADSARERVAEAILEAEVRWPFNLSQAPLMRATVLRLSVVEHILLIVMHHTISDGWSLGILLRELKTFYKAALTGRPAEALPELPINMRTLHRGGRPSMKGPRLQVELDYWTRKLAGAPDCIDLPADHAESDQPNPPAGRCSIQLDSASMQELVHGAQQQGGTAFHALMSALAIAMKRWTGRDEMVIGTVVAGRDRPEVENVIGCFMNFVPIRINLSEAATCAAVLKEVKNAVLEAQAHQDCPFEKMVEALNPERRLNRNPLYNVALLFQNYRGSSWNDDSLASERCPDAARQRVARSAVRGGTGRQWPPRLVRIPQGPIRKAHDRTIVGIHAASAGIFGARTDGKPKRTEAHRGKRSGEDGPARQTGPGHCRNLYGNRSRTLTALAERPGDWRGGEFAPFNQVFQELLDPKSLLRGNRNGLNILLIRLQDWRKSASSSEPASEEALDRSVNEFVVALRNAAASGRTPWLVCVCPNSPSEESRCGGVYRRIEKGLAHDLGDASGVYLLGPEELERWYPVKDYYDPAGDELGHVPYTPVYFTVLATALARKYHTLKRPPCKVIALDCDHTLWSGVCGEDGAEGVGLTPLSWNCNASCARNRRPVLLCLCSKNNENDVVEVFDRRDDMPLRREHLAAWKLNWRPKSENLKALAEELGLGLDSFVFIDDNPLECADVEANCPEVLTLQLPQDPAQIPHFLQHCWVFDHLKLTAEDRKRSDMYRQSRERERLREQLSMADFLASLELEILIEPIRSEQLSRAAQLTQRTNQLNLTTRRRTEAECNL